jgi:hypothetical protein
MWKSFADRVSERTRVHLCAVCTLMVRRSPPVAAHFENRTAHYTEVPVARRFARSPVRSVHLERSSIASQRTSEEANQRTSYHCGFPNRRITCESSLPISFPNLPSTSSA